MLGLLLSILGYLFLEILVFFLFFLDFENVFVNNEWKLGNVFIWLYFLKYYVKYLKDKCYKCMKKFYLMDWMGLVKDVMYYKGCFICKVCGIFLNMKNYYFNKNDMFDYNIYCKFY